MKLLNYIKGHKYYLPISMGLSLMASMYCIITPDLVSLTHIRLMGLIFIFEAINFRAKISLEESKKKIKEYAEIPTSITDTQVMAHCRKHNHLPSINTILDWRKKIMKLQQSEPEEHTEYYKMEIKACDHLLKHRSIKIK